MATQRMQDERKRLRQEAKEKGIGGGRRGQYVKRGLRSVGRQTVEQDPSGFTTPLQRKELRKTLRQEGLRGPAVKAGLAKARGEKAIPPPEKRLAGLAAAGEKFGYGKEQDALSDALLGELEGGPTVDLRHGDRPTFDFYQDYARSASPDVNFFREQSKTLAPLGEYARERLAEGGLTPEEEASIRGRERGAIESGFREGTRGAVSQLAAAGLDPRGGIAGQRALQLQRARAGGLTDVERGITQTELGRKKEIEDLNRGVAGLEEQARLGDVNAQNQLTQIYNQMLGGASAQEEGGRRVDVGYEEAQRGAGRSQLGQLASLGEDQRQYDFDYAENAKQARKSREAYERAAEALKPSRWEKASGIIGGLFGGLGGGG
jgi:hypothetical protein